MKINTKRSRDCVYKIEVRPFDYLLFVTLITNSQESDIAVRVILQNSCYDSMPATGMICLAAAANIPDSIVSQYIRTNEGKIRISHPLGLSEVEYKAMINRQNVTFDYLGFSRTARVLMQGNAFIPCKCLFKACSLN